MVDLLTLSALEERFESLAARVEAGDRSAVVAAARIMDMMDHVLEHGAMKRTK
jgi:hypothetical protein